MSKWKLRSPDSFNPAFALAVKRALTQVLEGQGEGEAVILAGIKDQSTARYHADVFRCWRWNLRQHPLHELHFIEDQFVLRSRIKQIYDGTWGMSLTLYRRENLAQELAHILEQ